MIENFQFGKEIWQLAGFEQVVGIARAGSQFALVDREGLVDQQAAGCEYAADRWNQRAMQVAEYQNDSTAVTSKRDFSRILEVCSDRFHREFPLLGGFAEFREEYSIAVDPDEWNAGFRRGECLASATAREVGDHAQPGCGPNLRELVTEEF